MATCFSKRPARYSRMGCLAADIRAYTMYYDSSSSGSTICACVCMNEHVAVSCVKVVVSRPSVAVTRTQSNTGTHIHTMYTYIHTYTTYCVLYAYIRSERSPMLSTFEITLSQVNKFSVSLDRVLLMPYD